MDPTTGIADGTTWLSAATGHAGTWRVAGVAGNTSLADAMSGLADATTGLSAATYGVDATGSLLDTCRSGSQLSPFDSGTSGYAGTSTTSS